MNSIGQGLLPVAKGSVVQLQFARHGSRGKKIAYPQYPFKLLKNVNPKEHTTNLKYAMTQFLGPKNYKGEYHLNKYYYAPQNHEPKYIDPIGERGVAVKEFGKTETKEFKRPSGKKPLQPFPQNRYFETNTIIDKQTQTKIFEALAAGSTQQQVAFKYQISVGRIEALVKLHEIEQKWEKENKITPELKKFSETMYKMFPLYDSNSPENMTEIPEPPKTLRSRFLAIAETEPFGPIDAAKVYGLEPASVTLEKLSKGHDENTVNTLNQKKKTVGFIAPVRENDKVMFRFKNAKVGEVGVRYGKSNRDNKKDRKIGFNEIGREVYI